MAYTPTERQREVLDFLRREPANVRRVAGEFGIRSQDAGRVLAALERHGLAEYRYAEPPALWHAKPAEPVYCHSCKQRHEPPVAAVETRTSWAGIISTWVVGECQNRHCYCGRPTADCSQAGCRHPVALDIVRRGE